MAKLFHLEISTPERLFFSGEIESLIINTKHGEMGILSHTLPMVTTLDCGIMKMFQNNQWLEAVTSEGFVTIDIDSVTILAQSCEWPHEINYEQTKTEAEELEVRLKKLESLREYKIAKAQLAIQLSKLRIKSKDV